MSNGFPYWQFHNEQWLTGKVSAFDLDAQGLFLHFCMTAWASKGAFNICSTAVQLRFRKSREWVSEMVAAMLDVGILVRDGEEADRYRIKFIDAQLAEMQALRETRSRAGRASAESRSSHTTPPAPPLDVTEGKVSRVEKSSVLNTCSTLAEHMLPTKGAETKPEPKSGAKKFDAAAIPVSLANVRGFGEEWAAWMEARAVKARTRATTRAQELLLKTLAQRPGQAVAAVQRAIKSNWTGFEWAWMERGVGMAPSPAPASSSTSKPAWQRQDEERLAVGANQGGAA